MASVVEICNSALNMLGGNNIIALTEDSKNARLLNQRYESVRDQVFRSHTWNCLIKRVELAQDTATPTHEYSKQYTLPSDCLRVLKVGGHHNGSSSDLDAGQKFKIEGNFLEDNLYEPSQELKDSCFGNLWQHTSSPYQPYPGYHHSYDAIGEYNGKFMNNQMVLKGGSAITPKDHIRNSYRNFFYPHQRWMYSGIRLANHL